MAWLTTIAPALLGDRLFFRNLRRSSNEELWSIVNRGFWTFSQTMALLELAARGQDVSGQLPRVIAMLECDDEPTRAYGWDALRIVFPKETRAIEDYNPRSSAEECRDRVKPLEALLALAPARPPNGAAAPGPGSDAAANQG